ncbi:unnamed protein product [Anisakis simplex]|uniref:PepSY domain-containing protein n=1 Tax=Anisakis simplex TaxID=6269 RepID=A0A0M3JD99_ANISI|nr:unnamed protein product [Anisakis simplex]
MSHIRFKLQLSHFLVGLLTGCIATFLLTPYLTLNNSIPNVDSSKQFVFIPPDQPTVEQPAQKAVEEELDEDEFMPLADHDHEGVYLTLIGFLRFDWL